MSQSNEKKVLILNKYEANLDCFFSDGENHTEQHNIKIVVDFGKNNVHNKDFLKEVEEKVCRKATNELCKIGKMSLFHAGVIRSKLFFFNIAVEDGEYVFFRETEINCIERSILYPQNKRCSKYFIENPKTKERKEVIEKTLIKDQNETKTQNLSLEERVDLILELRRISKFMDAYSTEFFESEPDRYILLRFEDNEGMLRLCLGIYTSDDGELLFDKEPLRVNLGDENLLEEYSRKSRSFHFSYRQKELIQQSLTSNKTYGFIRDAYRWYSHDNAIKKISELFYDGLIEWELDESVQSNDDYDSVYEELIYVLSYNAEYGDAKYRFLAFENEDGEERNYLEIHVESYFHSRILLSSEEVRNIGLGSIYIHEFALEDVVVKTEAASCLEKEHTVDRVKAIIPVVKRNSLEVKDYEIEAYFCSTCNRYYILEKDYQRLRNIGILLCRVTDPSDVKGNFSSWAAESILKQCGYSVAKNNNLTTKERHVILEFAVETGIMSKDDVLSHLEWLVRQNSSRPSFKEAVSKWNDDIRYLRGGQRLIGSDIRIRSIFDKYKR